MAASAPASSSVPGAASSASSPAPADDDDGWGPFEARVKGLVPAMVGLTSMFTARHLPCPLRTLSGTLASVGFDLVTLRGLHSIAPRLLSVAYDPQDPGASNVRCPEYRLVMAITCGWLNHSD